jgi:hypothetical protein
MIRIIDVEYLESHILQITFNNGEKYDVDFKDQFNGKAYQDLKSLDNFKQFGLIRGTLEWYNQADFAPEYLYQLAVNQNKVSEKADFKSKIE